VFQKAYILNSNYQLLMDPKRFSHLPDIENLCSQPAGTSRLMPFEEAKILLEEALGNDNQNNTGRTIPSLRGKFFVAGKSKDFGGCISASPYIDETTGTLYDPIILQLDHILDYIPKNK